MIIHFEILTFYVIIVIIVCTNTQAAKPILP